jgi:1,2-phenylacetyl-CoA epoxidase catalytic subunit
MSKQLLALYFATSSNNANQSIPWIKNIVMTRDQANRHHKIFNFQRTAWFISMVCQFLPDGSTIFSE